MKSMESHHVDAGLDQPGTGAANPREGTGEAPPRLSEALYATLLQRLEEGGWTPGERLPTEKSLGERFGVSRAVVREALARLKADGRVTSRQGAGMFVAQAPVRLEFSPVTLAAVRERGGAETGHGAAPAPLSAGGDKALGQLFELRALVEMSVAELAARRRQARDLQALEAAVASMETVLEASGEADHGAGALADDHFHGALAAATGNVYVAELMEFMSRQFSATRRLTWSTETPASVRQAAQAEHRALLEAVRCQDALAARRLALAHMEASAQRLGVGLSDDLGPAPAALGETHAINR